MQVGPMIVKLITASGFQILLIRANLLDVTNQAQQGSAKHNLILSRLLSNLTLLNDGIHGNL